MTGTPTPRPISTSFFDDRDDTVLTWLGMAGLLVNARGTVLLVDPLLVVTDRGGVQYSETGLRLKVPLPIRAKDVPRADVVMFTHAEDDHCGLATARVLNDRLEPAFFAPPPVFERLRDVGIDAARRVVARDFDTRRFGDVEITVTPALHDHDPVNPWRRGDCVGYLVRTPDGSVWHPGDSRLIDELLAFTEVDVLLWDVSLDCPAHLCPPGSAELAKSSGAKALVAYHYGTMEAPAKGGGYERALESDPDGSLPFLEDIDAPFLRLDPGETLTLPLD
ncbi:MAG TPA: MBL fold metallo-hydrolase [Planctomycetota bacterium]|nr:MBL fold metallo-hydrolase [Planctomycetota bacterium]